MYSNIGPKITPSLISKWEYQTPPSPDVGRNRTPWEIGLTIILFLDKRIDHCINNLSFCQAQLQHQIEFRGNMRFLYYHLIQPATPPKKMTTPSRKLRHTAEASLTVFTSERGGRNTKNPYFNVL